MELITNSDGLGIAERIESARGRRPRTRILAVRFTSQEEAELLKMARANGKLLGEWVRDVLLREVQSVQIDNAIFTEVIALRHLLNRALRPLALGDKTNAQQWQALLDETRETKHDNARNVLSQYQTPTREQ